jgi:hypothetical protein
MSHSAIIPAALGANVRTPITELPLRPQFVDRPDTGSSLLFVTGHRTLFDGGWMELLVELTASLEYLKPLCSLRIQGIGAIMFVAKSRTEGAGSVAKLRAPTHVLLSALALLLTSTELSLAQDAASEQERLYALMVRQPANYDVTFAFVKAATDRGDYEAAIGALERLLYYNPDQPLVKYEIGTLYYRLRAYEMAKRYFLEALASPGLDAETKARIETYLPMADKQLQQSRWSGFAQVGVRYQTNASFAPSSGLIRFGGTDILPSIGAGKADWNWFALTGISNDYDLQNQRGDVLETRFIGYLNQQFRLTDFDVGLFDASFGPRMALAPDLLPGVTVKPYVTGGNTWVAGSQYYSSVGAGISLAIPVGPQMSLEPVFEWRRADFSISDPAVSGFGSGNWYTGGLASSFTFSDQVKLDTRVYYRHGDAALNFQVFNQWTGEAALTFQFAAPFSSIPQNWAFSPFVRVIRTDFGAPNPAIDPTITRTDTEWDAGLTFNTPFSQAFGLSTTVQYARTDSTLPNYRLNNLSILSGPTVRF